MVNSIKIKKKAKKKVSFCVKKVKKLNKSYKWRKYYHQKFRYGNPLFIENIVDRFSQIVIISKKGEEKGIIFYRKH